MKTLLFVDGENLWLRYSDMVKAGRKPRTDNIVIDDCFVWNHRVLGENLWDLKRLSYYTSRCAADEEIWQTRRRISAVNFQVMTHADITYTGQIVPFVRKKSKKTNKESICDIAIAVDVMRACYRDHAEAIWIISGDGDFCALFQEVIHSGKVAIAGSLSSGLNPELPLIVDEFRLLDKCFFESEQASIKPSMLDSGRVHP